MVSTFAVAAPLKTQGCSRTERSQIQSALNWLLDVLPKIDGQLQSAHLSDWPGRSRKRFVHRIKKRDLNFICQKKSDRCEGEKVAYWIEADGKRLPVLHAQSIQLCTRELRGSSDYALVIAHELGHLVWVNSHQKQCAKKCLKPRLSRSLERAVLQQQSGIQYDINQCLVACGEFKATGEGPEASGTGALPSTPSVVPPAIQNP